MGSPPCGGRAAHDEKRLFHRDAVLMIGIKTPLLIPIVFSDQWGVLPRYLSVNSLNGWLAYRRWIQCFQK